MMTLGCIHIRVVSTSQHTSSGLHRCRACGTETTA